MASCFVFLKTLSISVLDTGACFVSNTSVVVGGVSVSKSLHVHASILFVHDAHLAARILIRFWQYLQLKPAVFLECSLTSLGKFGLMLRHCGFCGQHYTN